MASDFQEPCADDGLAATTPQLDFSSVLGRTIASVREDPAQLRNVIYELARVKLQREAWARNPRMSVLETRRLMLALETAIERVETLSSGQDAVCGLQLQPPLLESSSSGVRAANVSPLALAHKRRWSGAAPMLRLSLFLILVLAVCLLVERSAPFGPQVQSALPKVVPTNPIRDPAEFKLATQASPLAPPQSPALPLPSVYGVYAMSNAQLNELEALPGRVPDQRVFMSAAIKTPSRTVLPAGRIEFIVYRRDLATNAPDRVQVRVIARIMRSMTFTPAGKASIGTVDDMWTIRGASYEFRVAPLSENPEMLVVRPENSDFRLPAGRYGLVLKGQAYDFSVAGPVTEAAQCLERIEAVNGAFYSECRTL
jgi:hypothetical protein